jgi:hypothetical protein
MNMQLRKELREFIKWQLKNNLLKEPLTIDYELAESYLESEDQQFSLQGVMQTSSCDNCNSKDIDIEESFCNNCSEYTD